MILTGAETEDSIKEMILDALRCHFDNDKDIPPIIKLHSDTEGRDWNRPEEDEARSHFQPDR